MVAINVSPFPDEVQDLCVPTSFTSIAELTSKVATIGREELIVIVEREIVKWVLW